MKPLLLLLAMLFIAGDASAQGWSIAPGSVYGYSGTPPAGNCHAGTAGRKIVSNRTAVPTVHYFCVQTSSGVYAWTAADTTGASSATIPLSVTRTDATHLTIGSACTTGAPCIVRVGATSYQFTAEAVVTLASGTDTVYIYVDENGALRAGADVASISCDANCTATTSIAAFPSDSLPIYEWGASSGAWAASGTDARAILSRERKLVAGANITLTADGDSVTVASTASYDSMDMTRELFDTWILGTNSLPEGWYGSAQCIGNGSTAGTQGPIATTFITAASTDAYCILYMNNNLGAGGSRWPDFVSSANFKAFTYKAQIRLTTTADVAHRFGAFASSSADAQGVYLEHASATSANWRCVVNDGTATATDTGVAASTSVVTLTISATAAGTLTCAVGATSVTAVDTFPAATFWGMATKTTPALNKGFDIAAPRILFTGLSR